MKKLAIIIAPAVILLIAITTICVVQNNISGNITAQLEEVQQQLREEEFGDLTFKDVSTDIFSQKATINDLRFTYEQSEEGISAQSTISADKCIIKQKGEERIETFELTLKDISIVNINDIEDAPEYLDHIETTTSIKEIVINFDGDISALPEEELTEAELTSFILDALAHDQYFHMAVKGVSTSREDFSIPFLPLVTEKQLKEFSSMKAFALDITYNPTVHLLMINQPESGNKYQVSSFSASVTIDADEAIVAQDLSQLQIGFCSLDASGEVLPTFKEVQLGDNANFGLHTLGGMKYELSLNADLSDLDLSQPFDEQLEESSLLESIVCDYSYSLSDLDLSFNTHENAEENMGSYHLGLIEIASHIDYQSIMNASSLENPMEMLNDISVKLAIKDLSASLPETIAPMLVMMGIPQEVVEHPEIQALNIELAPEDRSLDLSKNLFYSNFGQIHTDGRINMKDMTFEDVSITMTDCPPALVGMASGFLPEEEQHLIDLEKKEQTIHIEGRLDKGLRYSN